MHLCSCASMYTTGVNRTMVTIRPIKQGQSINGKQRVTDSFFVYFFNFKWADYCRWQPPSPSPPAALIESTAATIFPRAPQFSSLLSKAVLCGWPLEVCKQIHSPLGWEPNPGFWYSDTQKHICQINQTMSTMAKTSITKSVKFAANISSLFLDIPDHIESYHEILKRCLIIFVIPVFHCILIYNNFINIEKIINLRL